MTAAGAQKVGGPGSDLGSQVSNSESRITDFKSQIPDFKSEISDSQSKRAAPPTVWGLSPVELHDRFWAYRGVQVIRPGDSSPISDRAQLYLLMEPDVLAVFEPGKQLETLYWSSPDLVYVRVREAGEPGFRERVVTDDAQRFVRFERVYERPVARLMRAAFSPDAKLAAAWRDSSASNGTRAGWRKIRAMAPRDRRSTIAISGAMYEPSSDADLARLVRDLTKSWGGDGPGAIIPRARQVAPGVWADVDLDPRALVKPASRCVGPVWIGAGRGVDSQTTVIGPAVLWDDPAKRPAAEAIVWPAVWRPNLPSYDSRGDRAARRRPVRAFVKRAFDIVFSACFLLLSLPFYPLIMLAIWLEDGRPFFFTHRRETLGGREFGCVKFRSMYRDAERVRLELQAAGANQADGPQFYVPNDARVTKVGRFLRRTRLDELPQFFNVLLGHMSVVGPRPSPFKENQFCPAWREARLSVRPGITGLWQVSRTRSKGQDFQEWIKFDIEYVERGGFWLDLGIILRTGLVILAGFLPARKQPDALTPPTVPPLSQA
jgi:lipopolysaccharide/colanic/teichoic acid biosynthesis glycosyltransferase